MKKWLRRILIAAALVGLTFGILYGCATHVGRGWLFGEAFYDGRPTSYWRLRCDEWLERWDEPFDAARMIRMPVMLDIKWDNGLRNEMDKWHVGFVPSPKPPRRSYLQAALRFLQSEEESYFELLPKVLLGDAETEPVLLELSREEKYKDIVERARFNIKMRARFPVGSTMVFSP